MVDPKIRTLLTLVSTGSFTAAAKELSLTQPAVSHHIRLLEEQYGVPIFYKDRKKLRPTPEGEIVIKYARRAAALTDKLRTELDDCRRSIKTLSIGITPSAQETLAPHLLAAYTEKHPDVHISLVSNNIKNLYDMVRSYELDVAIVDGSFPDGDMTTLLLIADFLCFIVAPQNPLARRDSVSLSEVKKQNLILRPHGAGTRDLFESHLHSQSESIRNFNVTVEVDNIGLIRELVASNLGATIISHAACAADLESGRLVRVPIENMRMPREVNMIYSPRFHHADILHDIWQGFIER